jgi:hypothetical protein
MRYDSLIDIEVNIMACSCNFNSKSGESVAQLDVGSIKRADLALILLTKYLHRQVSSA